MIGFIEGKVKIIGEDFALLLTHSGAGYIVFCTSGVLASLKLEENTGLYIETIVREDAITLFGFSSYKDLVWFKSLVKISGVGSKTALLILSSFKANEISNAIESGDKNFFCSVPGIGEKLALRIVNEAKKEPKKNMTFLMSTQISGLDPEPESQPLNTLSSLVKDASLALESLGFAKNLCYSATVKIFSDNPQISLQDLIKQAIKRLKETQ